MSKQNWQVGWYVLNDEKVPVYANEVTGECFYTDEQGMDYLVLGIDHSCAHLEQDCAASESEEIIAGSLGVIYDGSCKYVLLPDERAVRVAADAIDISDPMETLEGLDYDCEYEPEDDGEDDE